MIITIGKSAIYEEVAKMTSYVGKNAVDKNGMSRYEEVRFTEQDRPYAERSINDAVNRLVVLFGNSVNYLSESQDGNDTIIGLVFPSISKASIQPLKHAVESFVTDSCVAEWLRLVSDDRENEFRKKAEEAFSVVRSLVSVKRPPVR